MYLENLNIRVKKYPKGYAVEVEKEKKSFLGLRNIGFTLYLYRE